MYSISQRKFLWYRVRRAATVSRGLGGALPVPIHVREGLDLAFGETVDRRSRYVHGHRLEKEVQAAKNSGVKLTYGEILPGGVAKALARLLCLESEAAKALRGAEAWPSQALQIDAVGNDSMLLELGMGIGMAAVQAFLQCSSIRHVVGIEFSEWRYSTAVAAAIRLTQGLPEMFQLHRQEAQVRLERKATGQVLEMRHGNILADEVLCTEELQRATAVLMNLVLPGVSELTLLQRRLLSLRQGARLLSLTDMRQDWRVPSNDGSCPLHYVKPWSTAGSDIQATRAADKSPSYDLYATSWALTGAPLYLFEVCHTRPPSITCTAHVGNWWGTALPR